ncbi:MAG: acetyl-CoA carboxylase biotin carboxyl carrier protein subunit, partial [Natronospirillum sp.]
RLTVQGRQQTVAFWSTLQAGARHLTLFTDGAPRRLICQPANDRTAQRGADEHALTAPMNGTVVAILVSSGQSVVAGTPLLVMEAMKMEHSVRAPTDGVVEQLYYQLGDTVSAGAELLALAPAEETAL